MSAPVEFSVWAPLPERVRLQVDGAVHDMRRDDDGWWRAEVAAAPGVRLRLPARRQRHAASRPALAPAARRRARAHPRGSTPTRYEWGDGAWTGRPLAGGVLYELHVGTFTPEGTLDAAIGRLGHLVDLGVDFVELLPVNAFNGTHNWGYDGVALVRGARALRRPGRATSASSTPATSTGSA